ncbi:MFS transporter [Paenibacillus sp. MWE-103]|uniref:MFS transporter n=1 Tax=Paenibacillus artemisiicola TaxID=1172618 RepID=A0ABS3W549_9BACL|nr:MFS transporter [Paenibacillus artemisiicola]MBO7743306.1 MFS transporter [Paenibacillus artemisiicola]
MTHTAALTAARRSAAWMLGGVSFAHLLNDAMQTAVPAAFPLFQTTMRLSFTQIGWVAFVLNITASVLQPLVGYLSDRRPMPDLLPLGMAFSLLGVLDFAYADSLGLLLAAAALIGVGSSVLHPESSRVARMAAGRGRGMAQSIFQVGGNTGQALAPLLVGFVLLPLGQRGFLWFTVAAVLGIAVQTVVGRWYKRQLAAAAPAKKAVAAAFFAPSRPTHSRLFVAGTMTLLIALLFSKFVYIAGMTGFYAFYFMDRYHLPLDRAQICLFALQFAGMAGTLLGGPLADRFGRKTMIWISIAGTAPFSLLLPHVGPTAALLLCCAIGMILMSGFSVIIVYAQELLPRHVGTVSGLFFGLSFGMAGLGSVLLGRLMDVQGADFVVGLCAFLPLIGVWAFLLPRESKLMRGSDAA